MDFAGLPWGAVPIVGETRASWLAATGRSLGIPARDWARFVGANPDEPERPDPRHLSGWVGFPPQLGNVRDVPVQWRLAPQWRHLHCPHCSSRLDAERRWPIKVEWLDARCWFCRRHRCALAAGDGPTDRPRIRLLDAPQLDGLCEWLEAWVAMDQGPLGSESLWRRDLVTAALRNWNPVPDHYGAVAAEQELAAWSVRLQSRAEVHAPGQPTRLGQLCPQARLAALLTAYRYWEVFDGRRLHVHGLPPAAALSWLQRRWPARC